MEDGQNFLGNFMQFLYIVKSKKKIEIIRIFNKLCGRPPQYAPALQVDL